MANTATGLSESNAKNLFIKQVNAIGLGADDGLSSSTGSITLPQNAKILLFDITETAGNAITGGLDVGTTVHGTDIISAVAVGASSQFVVPDAALLKRIFSGPQQLFFSAHTSWNGALITVNIIYCARIEFGT